MHDIDYEEQHDLLDSSFDDSDEDDDGLDVCNAPSRDEVQQAKAQQNTDAQERAREAARFQLNMDNVKSSLIPILTKKCLESLATGRGIPDSFEDGLNAARKKYGAVGEDVFIQFLNRELADRKSHFRVRPGAIPAEHANNPNYRVFTLTDARNGNSADTAQFALGRNEAPAPEVVRPIAVTMDNVHQSNIPDLVARCLAKLQNGTGIPDSFETGLNDAIKTYGPAGEAVFIQLMNNKLASGNSNFRIRPGAIPAAQANNADYRVYTLTHIKTGELSDTAEFPLRR